MYPVDLNGELTHLREFRADDFDAVYAVFGDDRVTSFLAKPSRSPEQVAKMLDGILAAARADPRLEYYLAVEAGDRVVGFARLGLIPTYPGPDGSPAAADLGYAIRFDGWGKHFGRDAAQTMLGFGFDTLGLHRVAALIGPDNLASLALVESLHFKWEGELREHLHNGRGWRNSVQYSMLEPEWRALQRDGAGRVLRLAKPLVRPEVSAGTGADQTVHRPRREAPQTVHRKH